MKNILIVFYVVYLIIPQSLQDTVVQRLEDIFSSDRKNCDCIPSYLCATANRSIESNCSTTSEVCCTSKYKGCGYQNPVGVWLSTETNTQLGEFPWTVAVLVVQFDHTTNASINVYQCGGALIHPQVVLTAAHCVVAPDETYKIRVGEWDYQTKTEPYPHQDRMVKSTLIHKRFKNQSNNIALLFLESPVDLGEAADTVCLPETNVLISNGTRCFVTGWGKDPISYKYQTIQKKVSLPVLDKDTCQKLLQTTIAEVNVELDDSLICAGGERKIATCKGDDGSPLVCLIPGQSNRYQLIGIVGKPSIACGLEGLPGLFTYVPKFRTWIEGHLSNSSLDMGLFHISL